MIFIFILWTMAGILLLNGVVFLVFKTGLVYTSRESDAA
jgi:hypothetical protein